jgi:hypothetical protein
MPETTETPAAKTMRQWYQAKLAERLIQVCSMERNRSLLRRGARKMQDGVLGKSGDDDAEEPMNIHIGDQILTATEPAPPEVPTDADTHQPVPDPSPQTPTPPITEPTTESPLDNAPEKAKSAASIIGKWATVAALLAGSGGLGAGATWLFGGGDERPAVTDADTDTRFDMDIRVTNPE